MGGATSCKRGVLMEKQNLLKSSPSRRRKGTHVRHRSCCATCCSFYTTSGYFITLVLTVFYLGYFIQLDALIDSKEQYSDQCILFSRYSKSDPQFTLGYDLSCELSVYGTGALALLLFVLMVMLFFNSVWGRWWAPLSSSAILPLIIVASWSSAIYIILACNIIVNCP